MPYSSLKTVIEKKGYFLGTWSVQEFYWDVDAASNLWRFRIKPWFRHKVTFTSNLDRDPDLVAIVICIQINHPCYSSSRPALKLQENRTEPNIRKLDNPGPVHPIPRGFIWNTWQYFVILFRYGHFRKSSNFTFFTLLWPIFIGHWNAWLHLISGNQMIPNQQIFWFRDNPTVENIFKECLRQHNSIKFKFVYSKIFSLTQL